MGNQEDWNSGGGIMKTGTVEGNQENWNSGGGIRKTGTVKGESGRLEQ